MRNLTLWRIRIGSLEDVTISHVDGLTWRRRWWRIWTADVSPWRRSQTRQCLTWRLACFLAELSLAEGGALAACEAMKRLNRAAKSMDDADRYEIYRIKQRFIGELLERHSCHVTLHVQALKCRSCGGTGTWWSYSGEYSNDCWKCNATGVFRTHDLLLFTFQVRGREYRWHQPRENWPNVVPDGDKASYVETITGAESPWLRLGLEYERLIETVARWIDAQGFRLGIRSRGRVWKLWPALQDDARRIWSSVQRRYLRWRPRRVDPRARIAGAFRRSMFPFGGLAVEPIAERLIEYEKPLEDADLPF